MAVKEKKGWSVSISKQNTFYNCMVLFDGKPTGQGTYCQTSEEAQAFREKVENGFFDISKDTVKNTAEDAVKSAAETPQEEMFTREEDDGQLSMEDYL